MNVLLRPLFIISSVLFLLHQVLQWGFKINLPWADAYLDNLLVMPLVLHLWLAERRLLFKACNQYELSGAQVIAATLYILLVTELIFPLITRRFTSDGWDIVYTTAGAFLYYWLYRQKRLSPRET